MSTQTTNLQLTKPALSDPANITLLNNNWDILDTKAKELTDGLSVATTKLNGISSGAEVNQNAFAKVTVGTTTITADAKQDTLTLVAGDNITLTPNSSSDSVTIAASGTNYSNASESSAGLMSADDKKKLNGIATNANKYTLPAASSSTLGGVKVGSGLTISDGVLSATGTDVAIDNALSASSTNPVQNKVVKAALDNKVDAVNGKGLSTNDYTTTEKNKLSGIAENANNYSLPTASSSTLGGVKTTSNVTSNSGYTACPIISGVPYYQNTTYTLPTASTTLGGVKTTSTVSSATGYTATPIISGVPYYKDTTYGVATSSANGLMSSTDKAKLDGMAYSYGTTDKVAGTSALTTGTLYFVYEA